MDENEKAHAEWVRRALDELLARLARAALADWNKKQPAKGTKSNAAAKPKAN